MKIIKSLNHTGYLNTITNKTNIYTNFPTSPQYIFNVFVYWIFTDFINPLVSASFYATEAEGRSNDVTFFRKPIWARVIERGREQMKKHFMELPSYGDDDIQDQKVGQKRTHSYPSSLVQSTNVNNNTGLLRAHTSTMPPKKKLRSIETLPKIRFLPKKNCVRPITNFRVKSSSGGSSSSSLLNNNVSSLYNCMHILKHIYSRNPVLIGFGAFGFDEIYMKIR